MCADCSGSSTNTSGTPVAGSWWSAPTARCIADSDPTRPGPRNFSSRPEFRAALAGGRPADATLGHARQTLQYFAVPIVTPTRRSARSRVTYPTSFVDARIRRTWLVLAGVGGDHARHGVPGEPAAGAPGHEAARRARAGGGRARAGRARDAGRRSRRARRRSASSRSRSTGPRSGSRSWSRRNRRSSPTRRTSCARRSPRCGCGWRTSRASSPDAAGTRREDVAGALAEVARLSRLVDGLLELARAERSSARVRADRARSRRGRSRRCVGRARGGARRGAGSDGRRGPRRQLHARAGSSRCSTTSSPTRWTSRPRRVRCGSPARERRRRDRAVRDDAGPGMTRRAAGAGVRPLLATDRGVARRRLGPRSRHRDAARDGRRRPRRARRGARRRAGGARGAQAGVAARRR